jgi:hypothetical protein
MRSGAWLLRHWRPINVPVLDHNGEVSTIIHHVEDVTNPHTARYTELSPTRFKDFWRD